MVLYDTTSLLGLPIWLIAIATMWTIIWKGLALWKSSQRKSLVWFVVLLVVNTLGILEILYIFLFSEIKLDDKSKRKKQSSRKVKRKSRRKRR